MTIQQYLNFIPYKNILNYYWYCELIDNLTIIEKSGIKININELNKYLQDRYIFENKQTQYFDDDKYNPDKYIICNYPSDNSNYEADDEDDQNNEQIIKNNFNKINLKFKSFYIS